MATGLASSSEGVGLFAFSAQVSIQSFPDSIRGMTNATITCKIHGASSLGGDLEVPIDGDLSEAWCDECIDADQPSQVEISLTRDAKALAMRIEGQPFRAIAEALGFNAPASARGAVIRGAAAAGFDLPSAKGQDKPKRAEAVEQVDVEASGLTSPMSPVDPSRLERGVEITVRGEGRYRFDRMDDNGASVTCWGPVLDKRQSWRTFRLERVRTIHRKSKARRGNG